MAAHIEFITPQGDFLEVILVGVAERGDFEEFLPSIRSSLDTHCLQKVLLDVSQVVYSINVLLEHEFAQCLSTEFVGLTRVAFVAPWSPEGRRPHIETTARNRGVNLLVFRKREDAVCWLGRSTSEDSQCCEPGL